MRHLAWILALGSALLADPRPARGSCLPADVQVFPQLGKLGPTCAIHVLAPTGWPLDESKLQLIDGSGRSLPFNLNRAEPINTSFGIMVPDGRGGCTTEHHPISFAHSLLVPREPLAVGARIALQGSGARTEISFLVESGPCADEPLAPQTRGCDDCYSLPPSSRTAGSGGCSMAGSGPVTAWPALALLLALSLIQRRRADDQLAAGRRVRQ